MLENRLLLRVWSKKAHKYLTDADIWDIFDSDAEDVWELLSEVNRPTTKFLEQQLREYKLTFEQCTGLRDKNDKLIYEGDIVKYKLLYEDEFIGDYYKEVSYNKGFFEPFNHCFNSRSIFSSIENIEVVGNIYENPELMEEK